MILWNLGADLDGEQSPLTDAVVQAAGGRPGVLTRSALEAQVSTLQHEIQRLSGQVPSAKLGEETGNPAAAGNWSALSQQQLETVFSGLQRRWGILDDELWQQQGGETASH